MNGVICLKGYAKTYKCPNCNKSIDPMRNQRPQCDQQALPAESCEPPQWVRDSGRLHPDDYVHRQIRNRCTQHLAGNDFADAQYGRPETIQLVAEIVEHETEYDDQQYGYLCGPDRNGSGFII